MSARRPHAVASSLLIAALGFGLAACSSSSSDAKDAAKSTPSSAGSQVSAPAS
jgi:hypothetical protein